MQPNFPEKKNKIPLQNNNNFPSVIGAGIELDYPI